MFYFYAIISILLFIGFGVIVGLAKPILRKIKARRKRGFDMREINAMRKSRRAKLHKEEKESLEFRETVARDNATIPITPIVGAVCPRCGVPFAKRGEGMTTCLRCQKHPLIENGLDQVHIAVQFDRTVNHLAYQRLRRKPNTKHLNQFVSHIIQASKVNVSGSPLVTFVPKPPTELQDSYYLGQILATRVAKATGLKMVKLTLENDQVMIRGRVKGRDILIIDDFIDDDYERLQTTAKLLKESGATKIQALVLARRPN